MTSPIAMKHWRVVFHNMQHNSPSMRPLAYRQIYKLAETRVTRRVFVAVGDIQSNANKHVFFNSCLDLGETAVVPEPVRVRLWFEHVSFNTTFCSYVSVRAILTSIATRCLAIHQTIDASQYSCDDAILSVVTLTVNNYC